MENTGVYSLRVLAIIGQNLWLCWLHLVLTRTSNSVYFSMWCLDGLGLPGMPH